MPLRTASPVHLCTRFTGRMLCVLSLLALPFAGMAQTPEQSVAAAPEIKTVTATGVGAGADKAKARDDAILDAQRRAVEQGVGLYIKSETVVANLQLISDHIYKEAGGYVHTYKVLTEGYNAAGDLYTVTIEAIVSMKKLEDDLNDLWERLRIAGNPRIVITVTPTSDRDDNIAESKIIELLLQKGFDVRDANQLKAAQQVKSLRLLRDDHNDVENVMLLRSVADLVIVGKSTAQPAETIMDAPSALNVSSAINARVIRTDTAQVIAAGRANGVGAGFTTGDALSASLEDAKTKWFDGKHILRQIIRAVLDPCQTYELDITGCTYDQIMQIDNKLLDARFIRSARILGLEHGSASMSVEFTGSNKTLANYLQTAAGIPLAIDAITANSVRVHVKGN